MDEPEGARRWHGEDERMDSLLQKLEGSINLTNSYPGQLPEWKFEIKQKRQIQKISCNLVAERFKNKRSHDEQRIALTKAYLMMTKCEQNFCIHHVRHCSCIVMIHIRFVYAQERHENRAQLVNATADNCFR